MEYPKFVDFLATEPDGAALAQHLVLEGEPAGICCGAVIVGFDHEAKTFVLGAFGIEESIVPLLESLSLWEATPWTDAIRNGEPVVFDDETSLARQYPELLGYPTLLRAGVVCPLSHETLRLGAIHLLLTADVDATFIDELADAMALCSLYLQLRGPDPQDLNIVRDEVAEPHDERVSSNGDTITQRQRAILGLMARDLTNAQIARKLGFSESTVKQEAMRIYRILGVPDRQSAVRVAVLRNIIENGANQPAQVQTSEHGADIRWSP